jgi:uncharacterized SAM-binding protein YcdF (DUF218 family)
MTSSLLHFLKQFMRLDSVVVWVLGLGIGLLLWRWRRASAWARSYFATMFAVLWLASTPGVSGCAARLIDGGYTPLQRPEEAHGAKMVVVLSGGSITYHTDGLALNVPATATAFRVIEGARLYRLLDRPTVVLLGGTVPKEDQDLLPESESMRAAILRLGVPDDHLVVESQSTTTREQAVVFKQMINGRVEPFVLVTSPTHMARSMSAFRSVGLNPIASPSALQSDRDHRWRWWPDDTALMVSDSVVYDVAARGYYWMRGWQ